MEKLKVGVLGATGMVGQRFIQLLEGHPWFEVTEVAASQKSAGRSYGEVMEGRWKLLGEIPATVAQREVKECSPGLDCRLIFSALDSSVAGPVEEEFAEAGYVVCSNSKNHRMDDDVPLLIPEVNFDHCDMLAVQRSRRARGGFIITNPNCSAIGLTMALGPIHKEFGLSKVMVTTLQALSGAGYPGVASLDVLDNIVPFISGEEGKVETEPQKILGSVGVRKFEPADIVISASCTRVNVRDGHVESVSVELRNKVTGDDIVAAWKSFNPLAGLELPSAPVSPIVVRDEENRPQPYLDRDEGQGMSCVVGRLRECPILDYKFFVCSHNTVRGAAGASILNAEYLLKNGYLEA
jgi:aspartate-semialdehyde dehydrogenase